MLFCCCAVLLFSRFVAVLFCYFVAMLFCCFVAVLFCCFVDVLFCCFVAIMFCCLLFCYFFVFLCFMPLIVSVGGWVQFAMDQETKGNHGVKKIKSLRHSEAIV